MRKLAPLVAVAIAVLVLSGCATTEPAADPTDANADNQPVTETAPVALELPSCGEFMALNEDEALQALSNATGQTLDENTGNDLLNGVWYACDLTPDRPMSEIIQELTGGQVQAGEEPDGSEDVNLVSSTQIGGIVFPGSAGGFRVIPADEYAVFLSAHGSGGVDNLWCGIMLQRDLESSDYIRAYYTVHDQAIGDVECKDTTMVVVARDTDAEPVVAPVTDTINGFSCTQPREWLCWTTVDGALWTSATQSGKSIPDTAQNAADVLRDVLAAQR